LERGIKGANGRLVVCFMGFEKTLVVSFLVWILYNEIVGDIVLLRLYNLLDFFRSNELANIQPNHILFHEVIVFLPKSKADVHRERNYVYISKLDSNYCPVAVLRRYI